MSVRDFLRMMPQIDRKYLDEAYRITAGRPAKKRGDIMKKTAKIALVTAACAAVIGGGAAVIYKLNHRVDVSPNKHGSGYVGNAPETVKFHAELPAVTAEDTAKKRRDLVGETWMPVSVDNDPYYNSVYYPQAYESLAYSEKGWYYIGSPTQEDTAAGVCYHDMETGQSVFLCAKPECLHDGSDYCPATNSAYSFKQLVWYDGMLYALAVKDEVSSTVISERLSREKITDPAPEDLLLSGQNVLLKIQPDGTGLEELAVLDDRCYFDTAEILAYRGALWVIGTFCEERVSSEPAGDTVGSAIAAQYRYGIWHYDLQKARLTCVDTNICNTCFAVGNLQADGDYVYFFKRSEAVRYEDPRKRWEIGSGVSGEVDLAYTEPDELPGLTEGIWRADARTGVLEKMPQTPAYEDYIAADGRLYWITMTRAEKKADSYDLYYLHTLENGAETVVRVPRGRHYRIEGGYLITDINGNTVSVSDLQGNLLRQKTFEQSNAEGTARYRFSFGAADGMLYCIRSGGQYGSAAEDDTVAPCGDICQYYAVPLAEFVSGEADFTEFMETCAFNRASYDSSVRYHMWIRENRNNG